MLFLKVMIYISVGLPSGTSSKERACQRRGHKRREFDARIGKIPWRRAWQPTPVFLPGESHGQREDPGGLESLGSQGVVTGFTERVC